MSKRRFGASIVTGNRLQAKVNKMKTTCQLCNIGSSHRVENCSRGPEHALKWQLMHRIFSLISKEKIRGVNCHYLQPIVESQQNEYHVSAYRQMTDLTSFRLVLDDQNTL
jgi:hypothetical protein